jgi:hypothetical protein
MCLDAPEVLDIAVLVDGRAYAPFVADGLGFLPLSKSLWAVVDETDFADVSRHKWTAKVQPTGNLVRRYAYRQEGHGRGNRRPLKLHRYLMCAVGAGDVDHWNGDGLDCRRFNMRPCTRAENNCNKQIVVGVSSYVGVTWDAGRGKWLAQVTKAGKTHTCGRFDDEVAAAMARDGLAIKLHGAFARLNFPEGIAA